MTDDERCLYLQAMLTGSPDDAAEVLRGARGEGPTTLELLALDELDFIELVRSPAPDTGDHREHRDLVVAVLGLTGEGSKFAEDCAS